MKTNAIRLIEASGTPVDILEYSIEDGALDAGSVAQKIGEEPDSVFKTLVTRGDTTGLTVFVIPGTCELHLKKAARVSGNKSIEMIKSKELLPLTGYVHGGCSPIGMRKAFSTYIDECAHLFDRICVSGGAIGIQVKLSPTDLADLTDATFAELT